MMDEQIDVARGTQFLLTAAAFVVVVAGMRAASSLIVPFLVAVFLAVISGPLVFWLQSKRVPSSISVLIAVVLVIGILTLAGLLVGSSLNQFLTVLPGYEQRLNQEIASAVEALRNRGIEISDQELQRIFDPGSLMSLVGTILTSVGQLVTNAFLIFLTIVFILLEASSFPDKVRAAFRKPETTLEGFNEFAGKLNRYVAIKTSTSLATGVVAGLWTYVLGVDFPLLWGLLAFLLNYIPNLGSIFAALPPILLGFLQYGLGTAILVAGGYLCLNIGIGSFLEPKFMGRGLGISTLVVFLSLVIWAWILGPVGMLLSVPLTITLKIALESSERTRWIGVLLGEEIPASSRESRGLK